VRGEPTRERQSLSIIYNPVVAPTGTMTNQTFRDVFHTETLEIDQRLKILSMTFLFTDLKGSTALYERVGDLVAYDLVREHFKVLNEIVASETGAVVKTIGDAVMATFPTADRGLAAALRMRLAMQTLNEQRGSDDLLLKIGLHEGPCLAVTLNDQQDYFGQTVNVAARVQGLADSQAIYASRAVVERSSCCRVADQPRPHRPPAAPLHQRRQRRKSRSTKSLSRIALAGEAHARRKEGLPHRMGAYGSGGPRGLQNRRGLRKGAGRFDSYTLPPRALLGAVPPVPDRTAEDVGAVSEGSIDALGGLRVAQLGRDVLGACGEPALGFGTPQLGRGRIHGGSGHRFPNRGERAREQRRQHLPGFPPVQSRACPVGVGSQTQRKNLRRGSLAATAT